MVRPDDTVASDASVPRPFHRHPGDGWAQCAHGHRHWGLHGAAGLLLARRAHDGAIDAVVLQHRALWSDQGGTWGFPGGALAPGETAEAGALREASEEAGIPASAIRLRGGNLPQARRLHTAGGNQCGDAFDIALRPGAFGATRAIALQIMGLIIPFPLSINPAIAQSAI